MLTDYAQTYNEDLDSYPIFVTGFTRNRQKGSSDEGSGSTTIASPQSEAAAFASDARNVGQWHTDILQTSVISGDGSALRT